MPFNNLVFVTDDEEALTFDSLATPYLSSRPGGKWTDLINGGCSTPRCNPSRSAFFHGQRPDRNGVITNNDSPSWSQHIQLPYWLQQADVLFGLAGKYLNEYPFPSVPGAPAGAAYWRAVGELASYNSWTARDEAGNNIPSTTYGGPTYFTDAVRDWGLEALDQFLTDPLNRQWTLYLAPYCPHDPFSPAPRHASIDAGGLLDPPSFNVWPTNPPSWLTANFPAMTTAQQGNARTHRRQGRRSLRAFDEMVEIVINRLIEAGEFENTIIWVFTDNGYAHGRHRVYDGVGADEKRAPFKWCAFPGLMRVRHPLATENRIETAPCTQLDITATLVAEAGLTRADVISMSGHDLDGMPLTDVILKKAIRWRDAQEIWFTAGTSVIPNWKLLLREKGGMTLQKYPTSSESALFDGVLDPDELTNVYADPAYAEDVASMEAILDELILDPHARDDQIRSGGTFLKSKGNVPVQIFGKGGNPVALQMKGS